MKPAPFSYVAPTTIDEVLSHLDAGGADAKILAGGQSLVPAMNFRLSRPESLIDINGVDELSKIASDGTSVTIGALVRHADLEKNAIGGALGEILAEVAGWVGHVPVRTRGTFGGSLAHADPAAEWAVLAVALDAVVEVVGPGGRREIEAQDFFHSVFSTALAPDELITGVRLPVLRRSFRFAFREFARRAGDFALVAVLTVVSTDPSGRIEEARIGLGGVGPTPLRASQAEEVLTTSDGVDGALLALAADAAIESLEPPMDIHASAGFRRKLVRNLTYECLNEALLG